MEDSDISRIIEMAWEDRTPFEAIEATFNVREPQVIELKKRVSGRKTKHRRLRGYGVGRFRCATQKMR